MRSPVYIGFPAFRLQTTAALTLAYGEARARLRDYPFEIVGSSAISTPIAPEGRNDLVEIATDAHADWLIMVDDDASFAPEAFGELLSLAAAHDDCVVAGLPAPCTDRTLNVQPSLPDRGFSRVDRVGAAVMAIQLPRLRAIGFSRPWFAAIPRSHGPPYGADYRFCDLVRSHGGKVYCDPRYPAGNGCLTLDDIEIESSHRASSVTTV